MVHKFTRTAFALVIGWLLAYGIGSAATDSCSPFINTCASSGIRSPLTPTGDAHCRVAQNHDLKRRDATGHGARFALPGSDDTATCCQKTPCIPVWTTVYLGNSPPVSPWMQQACISDIIHCNLGNNRHIKNRYTVYDRSAPIYLLTKTIIC